MLTEEKMIKIIRKNRIFFVLLSIIFFLHVLTYPSIHLIFDDYLYLNQSNEICSGNFTSFTENPEARSHGPLYPAVLCLTSPMHNFDIYQAQLVNFGFLILIVIGWYYFTRNMKIDRKKMVLLLFANSLLWVYSFRVLIDIPVAFFLSLGMLNAFLFFEKRQNKNYYWSILFLSLSLFTKESSFIFIFLFLIYLLFKKTKDIKKWSLLTLPLIPYLIYQVSIGFQDIWVYKAGLKATTPFEYSYIPYGIFPTILFMLGIFGLGFLSVLWMWKNISKIKGTLKNFLLFSLILYVLTELFYDFVISVNLPRYHTILMPFLTLIISESSRKSKTMNYIYYITLIYLIFTGLFAAYYFHTSELPIWKDVFK